MASTDPNQVIHDFAAYFNAGDLDGLMAELYEDGAVLTPEPGAVCSGKEAIAGALKGFLALGGTLVIEASTSITNGDLGLTHSRWRLDLPEGDPMVNTSAEVVRRQPDGSWRYAIDNPFGGGILG